MRTRQLLREFNLRAARGADPEWIEARREGSGILVGEFGSSSGQDFHLVRHDQDVAIYSEAELSVGYDACKDPEMTAKGLTPLVEKEMASMAADINRAGIVSQIHFLRSRRWEDEMIKAAIGDSP